VVHVGFARRQQMEGQHPGTQRQLGGLEDPVAEQRCPVPAGTVKNRQERARPNYP